MNNTLQELTRQVGELLKRRQENITTAESCTGGWLAKTFTDINGSSAWFDRGFVTYSNQSKQQMLGVSAETLRLWGAVSEQTVREMAQGAQREANVSWAVAVSGIAGPDGGTPEKPVGTVWFGFSTPEGKIVTTRRCFPGQRDDIRRQAVTYAVATLLSDFLKKQA